MNKLKIDKDKLKAMSMLSDEELWRTIRTIGYSHGIKTPEVAPSAKDMQKIKAALRDADKINLAGALKIIDNHRKGKG